MEEDQRTAWSYISAVTFLNALLSLLLFWCLSGPSASPLACGVQLHRQTRHCSMLSCCQIPFASKTTPSIRLCYSSLMHKLRTIIRVGARNFLLAWPLSIAYYITSINCSLCWSLISKALLISSCVSGSSSHDSAMLEILILWWKSCLL